MKRALRAFIYTFSAKNTFGSVKPFSAVVRGVNVHRAQPFAFSAGYTFFRLVFHPQQRKIACRLEEHGNRAKVLAKGAVILKNEGKRRSADVVNRVADDEAPEHDFFKVRRLHNEKPAHKKQRRRKSDIADKAQLFARLRGNLIRQKVKHHRRPTGIAAPASSENQRSENFCHGVMNRRGFKNAEEKIVPKALNLHIFAGEDSEIDEHIKPHGKLHHIAGILIIF
jgi:hypothetical protein